MQHKVDWKAIATRTNIVHSPTHPEYHAHSSEVRELLGLGPKAKLPLDGMPARYIDGVKVWVNPHMPHASGRKSSVHRVRCMCPDCGQELSLGRLHQHVCDKK